MRILYLNPSGNLGGAEISLLEILASMRESRPDWTIGLITAQDGPLATKARNMGVEVEVVPFPEAVSKLGDAGIGDRQGKWSLPWRLLMSAGALISYERRLRLAVKRFYPDVMHTNGFKMHILGIRTRPRHTPVIWHIHDYVSSRPIMKRLLSMYAGDCAHVVANSESVRSDIQMIVGDSVPVICVYNSIDVQDLRPDGPRADLDRAAGLEEACEGIVRIGLLGTFARWKGHEVFLQALSQLPPELAVRGYIIGAPLYQTQGSQYSMDELQALGAKLGLSNKIGFTGFMENRAEVLRALDVVVHASTSPEPFGMVIVEAMACGRAVIAADAGGAAELIKNGVTALAHPPGDARILSQKMARLASRPDLREQLGRQARAVAEQRFDRSRLAAQLIPIYSGVVSGSGIPRNITQPGEVRSI